MKMTTASITIDICSVEKCSIISPTRVISTVIHFSPSNLERNDVIYIHFDLICCRERSHVFIGESIVDNIDFIRTYGLALMLGHISLIIMLPSCVICSIVMSLALKRRIRIDRRLNITVLIGGGVKNANVKIQC